jgi:predicted RNA-binding protein (virulence factor B family)
MIQIGRCHQLKVLKASDFGVYLDGRELGEILLPRKLMPEKCDEGDLLEVFVCHDSEDRLMATTEKPLAQVGEIAVLKVISVSRVGAFLDWGLSKDLLLPFREQQGTVEVGEKLIVAVYLDSSERIAASMRLDKQIKKVVDLAGDEEDLFQPGQKVDLLIAAKTDLGYKAVVNGTHWGVLYAGEVFQPLHYADRVTGYIRQVRPDGKIDLALQREGHRSSEDIAPLILEKLREQNGFLPINDKTSAEIISSEFGVSRKKFKMALGGLYKQRQISVDDDGIRLLTDRK